MSQPFSNESVPVQLTDILQDGRRAQTGSARRTSAMFDVRVPRWEAVNKHGEFDTKNNIIFYSVAEGVALAGKA